MISFKEFLLELFDKPVPYREPRKGFYEFIVDKNKYILDISPLVTKNVIEIELMAIDNLYNAYDLTNRKHQFPVLATIKKISEDHFTRYPLKPDQTIIFDTANPKSANLYTKYAKWLANYVNRELKIVKSVHGMNTKFEIVKK